MLEPFYYVEKRDMLGEMPLRFSAHVQDTFGIRTAAYAHIHDYIEILYPTSGFYKILLNNREYYFGEGDMVLINSNEIHNIMSLSEGMNTYLVIKFEPEILYTTSQSIFEMKYLMPFILKESNHQKVFKKETIERSVVPQIIHAIHREYADKNYGYELAIRANILNLFLFILRSWHEKNVGLDIRQDIEPDRIRQISIVFDYIQNNYQEALTSSKMADMCHLSYSYFSRIFKKIMRKSFKYYLNYIRISQSEKLLITTRHTITEIAMAVGFSSSSYFIQQFNAYKGVSPKQFRKKYKEAQQTPDDEP